MKVNLLKAAQRGTMENRKFRGFPLFSNGATGTGRLHNFGSVYVFNDDYLYPKSGLGMHPHANVEIITVMVAGRESHEDSLGHYQELGPGAVQLISGGRGIEHAGGNLSASEDSRHLQIWVAPRTRDETPTVRVNAAPVDPARNAWRCDVSPDGRADSLTINQAVWLFQGDFDKGTTRYALQQPGTGLLLYVLAGTITVGGQTAAQDDTLFITEATELTTVVENDASLVLMETVL